MTNVPYFDADWQERQDAALAKTAKGAQDYCYCGHIRGVHFSMATMNDLNGAVTYGHFRCHGSGCVCDKWRWDKRLRSKIKRKIGKRRG